MLVKLKFFNDLIVAALCCVLSVLGGISIYFPALIESTAFNRLSDAVELVTTGTIVDTVVLVLLFLYSIILLLLANSSYKLGKKKLLML